MPTAGHTTVAFAGPCAALATVFVAIRPTSRALSTAQGKGLDRDAAKASAMMASIESWHAEHAALPLVYDSHRARFCHANPTSRAAAPCMTGA